MATRESPSRTTRDHLHKLIDGLPECELDEAQRYLHGLSTSDPVLRTALLAPLDDEPLDDDDMAALEQAAAEIARGEVTTLDELKRELHLE